MKCLKCGKEIADDSKFCEFCGAKVLKPKSIKVLWVVLAVLLGLSALSAISYYVYDAHRWHVIEVAEAKAALEEAERLAEEAREKARRDSIDAAIARQKQLQAEEEAAVAQQAKLRAEQAKARAEREADEMRRRNDEKLRAEEARKEDIRKAEEARKAKEARKAALKAQGYVDLGLPSGTLWKNRNEEGFYTWEQAMEKFGNDMPTIDQMRELINSCQPIDNPEVVPAKLIGSNGNSITLPAYGYRNCIGYVYDRGKFVGIWSSSLNKPGQPWCLTHGIRTDRKGMDFDCWGLNVRLVKKP